jgi:dUTP pyrophosphatase
MFNRYLERSVALILTLNTQVIVINLGTEAYTFTKGQKIAQLVLKPVIQAQYIEGELGTSDRGIGGFGSTGLT